MCANRKQGLNAFLAAVAASTTIAGSANAGGGAGGVAIGEGHGGVADEAFVIAPPHYFYVVEKEPGSFLDCGEGQEVRRTDDSGRDEAALSCGVTLTETIVIPAASASARIIIHY
jgi:hypothetical protein